MREKKETKNRMVTARTNESTYQIIKNSQYTFSEALEWFAGNLTQEDNRKYIQLKLLEDELETLNDIKLQKELKIDELKDAIGDKELTGKEYNKPVVRAVHNTITHYKTRYEDVYSIDEFLTLKDDYLLQNATRCGLEIEELKQLVLNKYNKELDQQTLI